MTARPTKKQVRHAYDLATPEELQQLQGTAQLYVLAEACQWWDVVDEISENVRKTIWTILKRDRP